MKKKQFTAKEKMLTYGTEEGARTDFKWRGCDKDYKVVELEPVKVKRVIE